MCHKESLSSIRRLQCTPFVTPLETGAEARVTGHTTNWDSKVGSQHIGVCLFCHRMVYFWCISLQQGSQEDLTGIPWVHF